MSLTNWQKDEQKNSNRNEDFVVNDRDNSEFNHNFCRRRLSTQAKIVLLEWLFPAKYKIIFGTVSNNYPKLNLNDWNFKQLVQHFRGESSPSD